MALKLRRNDGVLSQCADVQKLVTGHRLRGGVTQGRLMDEATCEKIKRHICDALERGATILTGGS